ncbi:MAG: hypothetical protein ABI862_12700 [Ilumatobacteraceae bacterium]
MTAALTTTFPVGAITPGVTIGSLSGEKVITFPSLVVIAMRCGKSAIPAAAVEAAAVVVAAVDSCGTVESDAGGVDVVTVLDDAPAAPHEVKSNTATAMV